MRKRVTFPLKGEELRKVMTFANALRECLGLKPLYENGDGRARTLAERFYRPVAEPRDGYNVFGMKRKNI